MHKVFLVVIYNYIHFLCLGNCRKQSAVAFLETCQYGHCPHPAPPPPQALIANPKIGSHA